MVALLEKIVANETEPRELLSYRLQLFTANLHLERFAEVIRIGASILENAGEVTMLEPDSRDRLVGQTAYAFDRRGDPGAVAFIQKNEHLLNTFEGKVFAQAEAYLKAADGQNALRSILVSAVGLGPVFDPANPLQLTSTTAAFFAGRIHPTVTVDMGQIRAMAVAIGPDIALRSLCCMLVNTAYESVKAENDHSPEFEVFRHVRNASSHGNAFFFDEGEPPRPASWRGLAIDHLSKGALNPLQGSDCFGGLFAPADAILLLWDIEQKLP